MFERNNITTYYFLFHYRFAFLALGGDGAKNENEIIKKSKFEDSEDLIDNLHDKRRPDFNEGYGNNQPMSVGASSALGKSKFWQILKRANL